MRYEEAKRQARLREEMNQLQDLPTAAAGMLSRGAMAGAVEGGPMCRSTATLLRDAADGLERRAKNLRALADELPADADSEELITDAMSAVHGLGRIR